MVVLLCGFLMREIRFYKIRVFCKRHTKMVFFISLYGFLTIFKEIWFLWQTNQCFANLLATHVAEVLEGSEKITFIEMTSVIYGRQGHTQVKTAMFIHLLA